MSLRDYELSSKLEELEDWSEDFYGLIMTAYRAGDTFNQAKIEAMWPEVCAELRERYNSPGGLLVGEKSVDGRSERREDGLYVDDKFIRAVP